MTRSLLVVSFALFLAPTLSHAKALSPGDGGLLGDLPRYQLHSSGPLLAKKKASSPQETPAAEGGDVLSDPPQQAAQGADGEEASTALPDAEVKVGGTVLGQSLGGATGFVFKQGIYTQSDLGGFFVLGNASGSPTGFTISDECGGPPCKPVPTSQLQPYIGLSVGYDILQWLGVQLSFGTGFVANAAVYGDGIENPRDYGLTNINIAVVGSFYVLDRLAIMGKVSGGASFLSPEPAPGEPVIGGNVGGGIGVRYATLLPDVFVGIDGNFVLAVVPSLGAELVIIPGFSFAPIIKYVF